MTTRMREDEVRALAARYGVPANEVTFAGTADEAASAAMAIGRQVAVKLVADAVVHKSKAGGVLLDLAPGDVLSAVTQMFEAQRARGVEPSGVTVEAMVDSGVEVVVGALHSPGFGPVVMFGAGGVDIELVGDIAFALAPLTEEDARAAIARTNVGRILATRFPRRVEDLVDLLLAVGGPSGLLLGEPISEFDLNPIVVSPERVVAVDARASKLAEPVKALQTPDPRLALEVLTPAIYPQSIAVLGASADERKLGYRVVRNLVDFGYTGAIYPVNAKTTEICGIPTFPTVDDLPHAIDRAVIALPASVVPGALASLSTLGTKSAHVYTAETPPLVDAIGGQGLRVLGPNCIGHYAPGMGVTMIAAEASSRNVGGVAMVSQSGTYAGDVVRRGKTLGLEFSFVSSVGNCDDVSPAELLAFCAADPLTEVVAFYLEGDRGAGEFFRLARSMDKPIVLLRGGRTAVGGAAAASHTGAMASDPRLLADAARQAGVLLVEDLDHMLDVLMVLQASRTIDGDGMALIGSGGGVAVVGADNADRWSLELPVFAPETQARLQRFAAPGASLSNPIDIPIWSLFEGNDSYTGAILEAVAADTSVSALCVFLDLGTVFDMQAGDNGDAVVELLARGLLDADRDKKPLVLVWRSSFDAHQEDLVRRLRQEAMEHGIPVLDSVDRAIAAIGAVRWLSRNTTCPERT